MEIIKSYINQISKAFGYEYNESFFSYLKSISKPNHQVCNKEIKLGEGGFRCNDCFLLTNAILCTECFNKSKDKHKNHNVIFKPYSNGFCDCGDASSIIKESFCPDHNGPFTNEKEIKDFICTSIGENNVNIIDPLINNIFIEISKKIDVLYNENLENEGKINENIELFKMFDELLLFVSNLYETNLAFFYLVVLKFTKNYPFETNHKCFKYDENENKVIIIKKNLKEKHICACPFFQIMINLFMIFKTKYDNKSFYTLFIQTYKNSIISSLSFVHSFAQAHEDSNLKSFRELGYQFLSPSLCKLIYDEKNVFFLENFFIEIYEKSKKLIELKYYADANELIYNLLWVLAYLPCTEELNKIASNMNVHSIIIDIISLITNLNTFEDKTQFTEFQREGFLYELLNCEIYGIQISILLCYLMDFNNSESVKLIFNKIFSKLIEYKNYKEKISQKMYTPHISIIKYYSIFLNRFCFHYALNNNSNLYDAFQYFLNLFPESRELNKFCFKELITYFGFMISQRYSFFNYFGESMILYCINFFKGTLCIIHPDIILMKYLLTLPEIQQELNIDNFNNLLNYSNIDHSNDIFLNLNQNLDNDKKEEFTFNERNARYINALLDFILFIMRDNLSMIKMAFKFTSYFKMSYKDELFEKLLLKEGKNLENLIRNEIIHYIITKQNLINRESCITIYNFYEHNEINTNFIINLLKENCDEIHSLNQGNLYSLKKEVFKFFDVDYIINYKDKNNAIKYTTEFQSTNYNILNTYLIDPLSIQVKLNEKIYDLFFNNKNIDNFLKFYEICVISNKFPILTENFFVTTSKFLCLFIRLYNNETSDFDMLKEKLINIFTNCKLEGKYTTCIQYILKLLSKEEIIKTNQKNENLKKNLKDKFRKKFDKQMENVMEKLSDISKDISDENTNKINTNEEEEICVYCRQVIKNDDLNNCIGKICYTIRDYFRDILKKTDEKLRKKTIRFITCNHNIHFQCYSKLISVNIFQLTVCPLCKKTFNAYVCDLSNIIKSKANEGDNFLKGLNLEDENNNNFNNINNSEIIMTKYKNLIDTIAVFFDHYCNLSLKKEFKIEEIYNFILNDFDTFIFYYNITKHKNEQIYIWKNILLSIRLICKYISNELKDLVMLKFKNIYKNIQELNFNYLIGFEISTLINEFIICLFILYDLDQKSKDKIKSIFQNNILSYIFIYMFIQKKENNFEEFLTKEENKEFIQKIINFYNLKYKICFLLYDEKEEDLKLNLDINSLKINEAVRSLINDNQSLTLKEQYIEYPNLEIISLPENFMEFCTKYMNMKCMNCQKNIVGFNLCLICGNKICDNKLCVTDKKPNGKKEYSLIEHSKVCGGGNTIFISGKSSEIIYLTKRQFSFSGIFVYLNSFGEYPKGYDLNGNFTLNQSELDKSIQIFIDMIFRKKGMIINSISE